MGRDRVGATIVALCTSASRPVGAIDPILPASFWQQAMKLLSMQSNLRAPDVRCGGMPIAHCHIE